MIEALGSGFPAASFTSTYQLMALVPSARWTMGVKYQETLLPERVAVPSANPMMSGGPESLPVPVGVHKHFTVAFTVSAPAPKLAIVQVTT